jgi:glyoxylase I family protein
MISTLTLDHIAIAADDTQAMAEWYCQALGWVIHLSSGPTAPQTQKVFMIGPPVEPADARKGLHQGHMFEVMPRNDTPRYDRNRNEPGISHIAWGVSHYDELLARLKAHRVNFVGEPIVPLGGKRLINFTDCEGNLVQILER